MSDPRAPSFFSRFAKAVSHLAGRPATFAIAASLIVTWAVLGPVFGFSESWQLTVNTFTTIVTFLMVFLIQNTQSRDAEAMQVKLDELLLSAKGAHDDLLDIEEMEEKDLLRLREHYLRLAERARVKAGGRGDGAGRTAQRPRGNGNGNGRKRR